MAVEVFITLTPREVQVLKLVASGMVNKEIADQFNISGETVKNHIVNIRVKLNALTRSHAVAIAKDRGII